MNEHRPPLSPVRPGPGTDRSSAHRPLVLVTGGSGLLGSTLIGRLVADHDVVSLDLDGDPTSPPEIEFICTDLTDDRSVDRALERVGDHHGGHIASVVHLAAYYDFAGRDSPLYDEITVGGTQRLLDGLERFDLDQFVFSSTMLVHEPTGVGQEIDEADPTGKSWPYPNSKVDTEDVIRHHAVTGDTSAVIVRIAGVYDEAGHSPPIVNQIKRIDGRWPTSHFYPADLETGQAFVHRDDAVDALVRIVERRAELPDWFPVLIGEPRTVGYGHLQDLIANGLHGHDWSTFRIPVPLAKLGAWAREKNPLGSDPFIRSWMVERASDNYDLDISAARRWLDWEPQHSIVEVIPEMIERLEHDRRGWYSANDTKPPRHLLPA